MAKETSIDGKKLALAVHQAVSARKIATRRELCEFLNRNRAFYDSAPDGKPQWNGDKLRARVQQAIYRQTGKVKVPQRIDDAGNVIRPEGVKPPMDFGTIHAADVLASLHKALNMLKSTSGRGRAESVVDADALAALAGLK